MTVLGPPLDVISKEATPYPAYLLNRYATGLVLFCAAFHGRNDAIHFARNDMTATCVDRDFQRLDQMRELYPDNWRFVVADAWAFAETAERHGEMWDVVSADTFLGDATDRSLQTLDLWCSLAKKAVTASIRTGQQYTIPEGWGASLFPRSDHVSWLVLTRD